MAGFGMAAAYAEACPRREGRPSSRYLDQRSIVVVVVGAAVAVSGTVVVPASGLVNTEARGTPKKPPISASTEPARQIQTPTSMVWPPGAR